MNKIDINIEIGDLIKIKNFDNYFKVIDIQADGCISTSETDANDGVYYDIRCEEDILEVKRPYQYKTIYKREEPILDEKEREYLSAVIKPFRNKVNAIVKRRADMSFEYEYIGIYLKNDDNINDNIFLPNFKTATMYEEMELYKEYTLKELGL